MPTPAEVQSAIAVLQSLQINKSFPEDTFIGLLQKIAVATPTDVQTGINQLASLKVAGSFPEEVQVGLLAKIADNTPGGAGGKTVTRSTTEPATKAVGDIWEELFDTAPNVLRYGWAWEWDGTRWRSPLFRYNASISNQSSSVSVFFPFLTEFDMTIATFRVNSIVVTTNSGASFWSFALNRLNSANASTNIVTVNTSAFSPTTWNLLQSNLNLFISEATSNARSLWIQNTATGTPGALSAAYSIDYYLNRK